jgi:hypothetical protein
MKRILIGIAVVFCAQVAFQTYLAVERTDIDFTSMAGSTTLSRPLVPKDQILADLTIPEPDEMVIQTVMARSPKPATRPQSSFASYRTPARSAVKPTLAIFKPVVIRIPSPSPTYAKVDQKVDQKSDKRSFPSKAVAVLKKPYDWIKTVASKLR